MITRRTFLKSSALSVIGLGTSATPTFLTRAALSTTGGTTGQRKILICIFQRGAMDGLMAVQPFNDKYFNNARSRLRMQVSKDSGLIDLDGRFAIHPAFKTFKHLFDHQHLAIVHGIGSPHQSRSHFDAQDYMENGTPGKKSSSGWLNRAASKLGRTESAFQSVSFTSALPLSLYGEHPGLVIDDLTNFRVRGSSSASAFSSNSFETLYAQSAEQHLRSSGRESFDAMRLLDSAHVDSYVPNASALYPTSPLGQHCKQVAQLIKADVGLEIAFVESTGWDTHVQQGTVNGQFNRVAVDFAQSITALWNDLEVYQDDVAILTMTEFGRTVKENGSGGTDHGRGSCMFVIANSIQGGKVHGFVPELAPENLADGRDLPVNTDFRSLFASIAERHLKIKDTSSLFPEWNGDRLNIFKS